MFISFEILIQILNVEKIMRMLALTLPLVFNMILKIHLHLLVRISCVNHNVNLLRAMF